jgi:cytochrome c556
MFPEGSLNPPTEAKPEVWQQWEDFEALALQMEHYARALGAAAENGLTAGGQGGGMTGGMATSGPLKSIEELSAMPAGDVYKLLGETCSACHTRFRIDKK